MVDMSPGFDMMFGVFPVIFFLVSAAVITVIIVIIVKSVATGVKNNASPVLTVSARVVAKRTQTSGGMDDMPSSTWYYATFEVASGDRIEFSVSGHESGMLAEGDVGNLTFQGTRYLSFARNMQPGWNTQQQ